MRSSLAMAARFGHTAMVISAAMYVCGGYVGGETTRGLTADDLWAFNFAAAEWTFIGPRASNSDEEGAIPEVADLSDVIMFPGGDPCRAL
jgi:hypothetical protein